METDKVIFMKILIVEDEPSLRELMQKTLVKERYVVETASTFHEASLKIADYSYDCILLDIMLPDGNGLKLLEMLKEQQKRESVIIISARDSIEDKVLGLEQGADDYLPKPFHLAELNARIKSVLRRQRGDGSRSLRLGNLRIEPDSFRVFVGDKELELLKKEYDILFYFANRPNHIIDKAVLAEAVWGDHIDQADSFHFVYAQVKNLRQQLKKAGATIEIRSIYGFGYKLVIIGRLLRNNHHPLTCRQRAPFEKRREQQQLFHPSHHKGRSRTTPDDRILRCRHIYKGKGRNRAGTRAAYHLRRQRRPLFPAGSLDSLF